MSTEYLAPGVCIEEVPFESHPIEGVSTGQPCDALVLPGKAWTGLRKMAVHICKRSPRCRALVIGADPGARLFALRALALELRLPLYRIDLSEVVSKYIGETEKNLRRLFDAAGSGEMILFFDEADALFGKRSEIRNAHGRYVDSKGGTLARRIENCAGIAILGLSREVALDRLPASSFEFIVLVDRKQGRRAARAPGKRQASEAVASRGKRPYAQFNFLVNLGTGNPDRPQAGFQECSNIGIELNSAGNRAGKQTERTIRKIAGLNKATDVTLKRGVINSADLYRWLSDIRNGKQTALRTVTIQLQSEDHTAAVQTWKLMNARIVKHVSGPLNAKGTDVAMEELTLSYERLEIE